MNLFGHVGLTIAAFYAADRVARTWVTYRRSSQRQAAQAVAGGHSGPLPEKDGSPPHSLDYRMVVIGSMLPDIIDKPLAFLIAPDFVNYSARSVGHSTLFVVLLLAISFVALAWGRNRGLLVMAMASGFHLILDQMWLQPIKVLWPALGWEFPRGTTSVSEWLTFQIRGILKLSSSDTPELIGALFVLIFAVNLFRPNALRRFLKTGAVD